MANNPVMGIITCPYCGATNPVLWNGNMKWSCVICKKKFKIHRQKLHDVQPVNIKKRRSPYDKESKNN